MKYSHAHLIWKLPSPPLLPSYFCPHPKNFPWGLGKGKAKEVADPKQNPPQAYFHAEGGTKTNIESELTWTKMRGRTFVKLLIWSVLRSVLMRWPVWMNPVWAAALIPPSSKKTIF